MRLLAMPLISYSAADTIFLVLQQTAAVRTNHGSHGAQFMCLIWTEKLPAGSF
jgi:hypothetical protein